MATRKVVTLLANLQDEKLYLSGIQFVEPFPYFIQYEIDHRPHNIKIVETDVIEVQVQVPADETVENPDEILTPDEDEEVAVVPDEATPGKRIRKVVKKQSAA